MKIRNGFVSNSSSSSFFLATKKSFDETIKYLGVDKDHPLHDFLNKILNEGIGECVEYTVKTKEDYLKTFDCDEEDYDRYTPEKEKKYVESPEYTVYFGWFSDESSNTVESSLATIDLNFENDEVCMVHSGGY